MLGYDVLRGHYLLARKIGIERARLPVMHRRHLKIVNVVKTTTVHESSDLIALDHGLE